jgi:hypothetical protein
MSNFRLISSESKERAHSIGGQTQATEDSSPPPSSQSDILSEPVGRMDLEVEMEMMRLQRMQRTGRQGQHPSVASISSSIWSSSGGDSEGSESYAWSASLPSGSSDSSDYSSYSGSSEDDESSSADGEEDQIAPLSGSKRFPQAGTPGEKKYPQPPAHMMMGISGGEKKYPQPPAGMMAGPPGQKQYPQPPAGMMEGLPFGMAGFSLESLKKDLEKVGRAILSSNAGEIAAERAQTLASINWLASHVPNAVLDQLGHETRKLVADEKAGIAIGEDESRDSRVASVVESDAMSDVSDLSQEQLNLDEFGLDSAKLDTTNEEEKKVEEILENLPGGIPALLSPKPSSFTIQQGQKGKELVKGLMSENGGVPDLGIDEDSIAASDSRVEVGEAKRPGNQTIEGPLRIRGKRLPYSSDYRCALLFVDISGFTKLSTKLDPEALSKVRSSKSIFSWSAKKEADPSVVLFLWSLSC